MAELYDELAVLLALYVDASITLVFTYERDALACAYANVLGRSGTPDDPTVSSDSTAAAVFESGVPARYDALQDWPRQRLVAVRGRETRPQSAIFVPVTFGGKRVGVLSVQSTAAGAYDDDDVSSLETCSLYLGARIHDEQQRAKVEQFERLASVDVLTGVANRNALDRALDREWRRARRSGLPLAMLMIDVDYFKAFNDAYGHVAGDATLATVAKTAGACLVRSGDFFARYGGEEFGAILPDTPLEAAVKIAETMRTAVESLAIVHEESSLGRVSISIGCAALEPEFAEDPTALVRAADAALYDAKLQGRNRVAAEGYRGSAGTPVERRVHRQGNLPTSRTRFFGRAADIEKLSDALRAHCVVTVVGAGGVGKTRLALHVATHVEGDFPGGTWFVDLVGLSDPSEIVPYVAASLRGLLPPRRNVEELIAVLRDRRVLLVLDNCEHVVDAAAGLVDTLTAELPELRAIATSREALSVDGEYVYRLGALDVAEGVALFTDRALAAGVSRADLHDGTIADIVRQLDGIPLALELAAPRLNIVSLADLRAGLGDRLTSLRSTSRRQPTRQQTLHALMDWSYRLLSPQEQTIFRRLSVFVGGWTADAAASICADDSVAEGSVAGTIESLVAKSLVVAYSGEGASRRFRMLETTREYAAEQLEISGDDGRAVLRHAHVFSAIALEYGSDRRKIAATAWQRRVTEERGNFQAALRCMLEDRAYEMAAQTIVALIEWLWERGSIYAFDIAAPLERTLGSEGPQLDPAVRAAFWLALACVRRRADPRGYGEASALAFAHYRASGPPRLAAAALRCLANATMVATGAVDPQFEDWLVGASDAMEAQGESALAAELMNLLGTLYTQTMDDELLPRALATFDRAIAIYESSGDYDRCGVMFGNGADVAFYMGDVDEALRRVRRAIGLLEQSDEPWQASVQYLNLGHFATWARDFETASGALLKAFSGEEAYGGRYGTASVFDKVARFACATGSAAVAARLLGYADLCYQWSSSTRQRREQRYVDEMRTELQAALGLERFAAESARGHAFSPAEAETEMAAALASRNPAHGING